MVEQRFCESLGGGSSPSPGFVEFVFLGGEIVSELRSGIHDAIEFYESQGPEFWGQFHESLARLFGLVNFQGKWSEKSFGNRYVRGPVGPLRHLAKEAIEAADEFENCNRDKALVELADCLIIYLDVVMRSGSSLPEIVNVACNKMEENEKRSWNKVSGDQPIEHVRDGE